MSSCRCFNCGRNFSGRKGQLFCSPRCRYKYNHPGDMVLTLKKKWFDMILSGEKKEEYREIKTYWGTRFENYFGRFYNPSIGEWTWDDKKQVIVFRNGYGKNAPEFSVECTIREDYGKQEWGAEPGVRYFVLTIHRIFGMENIKEE